MSLWHQNVYNYIYIYICTLYFTLFCTSVCCISAANVLEIFRWNIYIFLYLIHKFRAGRVLRVALKSPTAVVIWTPDVPVHRPKLNPPGDTVPLHVAPWTWWMRNGCSSVCNVSCVYLKWVWHVTDFPSPRGGGWWGQLERSVYFTRINEDAWINPETTRGNDPTRCRSRF